MEGPETETAVTEHGRRRARFSPALLVLAVLLLGGPLLAQVVTLDFDRVRADEAFRDGVVYFHSGRINESVIAFQRALSLKPDDVLARYWLGRAYFFGGYEEAAEEEWSQVAAAGGGTPALQSFQATLAARRGFTFELDEDREFFQIASFNLGLPGSASTVQNPLQAEQSTAGSADTGRISGFMPGMLLPRTDGWFYAANFTGNTLQVYDANGRLRRTITGDLNDFRAPYGVADLGDGRLAVSSFLADTVYLVDAASGVVLGQLGGHGIGAGEFIGPQHLSFDGSAYIYVNDFGNQRIQKWTSDGEFVLSFGGARTLSRPTGLLAESDRIFVLDRDANGGVVLQFDPFGNLLERFSSPLLAQAESIRRISDSELLVTTRNAVYRYFPAERVLNAMFLNPRPNNHLPGFIDAAFDANANILVSDAVERKVHVLSRLSGLYSGIHVQINRIDSTRFPEIRLDVSVEDRVGRPVLGLDGENFLISESSTPVAETRVARRGYQIEQLSTRLLVSPFAGSPNTTFVRAAEDILVQAWNLSKPGDTIQTLSGGTVPQVLRAEPGTERDARNAVAAVGNDPGWAVDLGLRFAANALLREDSVRQIVMIGDGRIGLGSFKQFGLEETAAYLRNNSIRFVYVLVGYSPIDPAIEYITSQSDGTVLRYFETENFATILAEQRNAYPGRYILEFRTRFDGDFGRKYLPVEVEVRHLTKSGRDDSGYFSPLTF